jgi:hypothetical protein
MATGRVRIPEDVAARVLVASAGTCCKCEERGKAVQIHHIDEDSANNDFANLAVMCLACHDETQITGGFARRLSPSAVRLYRDEWVARVKKRKRDADELFIAQATSNIERMQSLDSPGELLHPQPSREELERFIDDLPNVLGVAYDKAWAVWKDSSMIELKRATSELIEVVMDMWLRLASAFPDRHFGGNTPQQYLEAYLTQRFAWQYALAEPGGPASSGTIAGLLAGKGVLRDLEADVVALVDALKGLGQYVRAREIWIGRWEAAKKKKA